MPHFVREHSCVWFANNFFCTQCGKWGLLWSHKIMMIYLLAILKYSLLYSLSLSVSQIDVSYFESIREICHTEKSYSHDVQAWKEEVVEEEECPMARAAPSHTHSTATHTLPSPPSLVAPIPSRCSLAARWSQIYLTANFIRHKTQCV